MNEQEVYDSINKLHDKLDTVISNQNAADINNAVVEQRVNELEQKNKNTRQLLFWSGTSIIAIFGVFLAIFKK